MPCYSGCPICGKIGHDSSDCPARKGIRGAIRRWSENKKAERLHNEAHTFPEPIQPLKHTRAGEIIVTIGVWILGIIYFLAVISAIIGGVVYFITGSTNVLEKSAFVYLLAFFTLPMWLCILALQWMVDQIFG